MAVQAQASPTQTPAPALQPQQLVPVELAATQTPLLTTPQPACTTKQLGVQTAQTQAEQQPTPTVSEDQSGLVASQAAELASARQAMQTMLQVLESSLAAETDPAQPGNQQQEVQVKASQPAGAQASGSLQDLFVQLTRHLAESEPVAAAADELIADQGQLVLSQAAELASARQAMQLLAQLLEQEAGSAAVSDSAVQAAVPEQDMQQALQQIMALLQPAPSAAITATELSSQSVQASAGGQVIIVNASLLSLLMVCQSWQEPLIQCIDSLIA